jgi:hypothetical protein
MQRREFIKRLVGVDFKTLLAMSGILLVIFVLFSADFTDAPGTVTGVVKIAGFLLMFFLLFLIVAIFISILIRQFLKLLPGKIALWLKKYGEKILLAIAALLLVYFIYDSIKKEKYFILFFMLVYFGLSSLFRDREKVNKSQ